MDQVLTIDALPYVRALPDECVDVFFTDSPYPNGMKYFEKDLEDARYVLSLAPKKARKRVIFYWSPMHPAPTPPKGWYLASKSIWHKPDAGTDIQYEDIYVWARFVPGVQRDWPRYKVYTYPILDFRSRRDFYDHPTQKSLDSVREVMRDFTEEGDTILDPFGAPAPSARQRSSSVDTASRSRKTRSGPRSRASASRRPSSGAPGRPSARRLTSRPAPRTWPA
jgi:DNA modification methylase